MHYLCGDIISTDTIKLTVHVVGHTACRRPYILYVSLTLATTRRHAVCTHRCLSDRTRVTPLEGLHAPCHESSFPTGYEPQPTLVTTAPPPSGSAAGLLHLRQEIKIDLDTTLGTTAQQRTLPTSLWCAVGLRSFGKIGVV